MPFSIKESLIFGWEAFFAHYKVFVPVVFISMAISLVSEYIVKDNFSLLALSVCTVGAIAQIIIGMGLTKIALKISAGEPVIFDDVFSVTHLFFPFIGAGLLYVLIVLAGLLLFVIPGFIWLISYWLYQYVLIDREVGIWAALSEAKRLSQGARWHMCKFMFVVCILNVAGMLTFFIGLFLTIPITAVSTAYVYRKLLERV